MFMLRRLECTKILQDFASQRPIKSAVFEWITTAPDSQTIACVDTRKGASNLWVQLLASGPHKKITHFNMGLIFDFAWSHEGKQLVVARGAQTIGVALINNFK